MQPDNILLHTCGAIQKTYYCALQIKKIPSHQSTHNSTLSNNSIQFSIANSATMQPQSQMFAHPSWSRLGLIWQKKTIKKIFKIEMDSKFMKS